MGERERECPWEFRTSSGAAGGGHLEVLKWMRENGGALNELTCTYAAGKGHLEVLKWLREVQCPWNENTTTYAAKYGRLEV